MNTNYKTNRSKVFAAAFLLLLVVFLFSFGVWLFKTHASVQRSFLFYSLDKKDLIIEKRFLPRTVSKEKSDVEIFVDDLLLGAVSERCKTIFSRGTRTLSVIEKDGVLYVNISKEALAMSDEAVPLDEGVKIFEKNILHNFPRIKKVQLFIDSVAAYEQQ